MNRKDHLEWAKKRAIEYLDRGDKTNAISSFLSDLGKHPELKDHSGIHLGGMLVLGGFMKDDHEIRNWIEGFN